MTKMFFQKYQLQAKMTYMENNPSGTQYNKQQFFPIFSNYCYLLQAHPVKCDNTYTKRKTELNNIRMR